MVVVFSFIFIFCFYLFLSFCKPFSKKIKRGSLENFESNLFENRGVQVDKPNYGLLEFLIKKE
jgi:hypothetical protein